MIISYLSKVEISGFAFFAMIYSKGGNGNATGDYKDEQEGTIKVEGNS